MRRFDLGLALSDHPVGATSFFGGGGLLFVFLKVTRSDLSKGVRGKRTDPSRDFDFVTCYVKRLQWQNMGLRRNMFVTLSVRRLLGTRWDFGPEQCRQPIERGMKTYENIFALNMGGCMMMISTLDCSPVRFRTYLVP